MSEKITSQNCPQCGAPVEGEGRRINCSYCRASLIRGQESATSEEGKWGVHYRTISCVDHQGAGIEAFRMLIPKEWEFEGGVTWLMNNPGMPAIIAFKVFNPQGEEVFEVFPNIPCFWSNNPLTMGFFPQGSLYFGSEVRPPAPALQVLRELVVPRHRSQVSSLEVVQEEHLPELAKQLKSDLQSSSGGVTSTDGGRIRIQYQSGDQEYEEDIFGVVEIARVTMPMMMSAVELINWTADYLFSFRALAGQLDHLSELFMSIVRSFRLNPMWFNRYIQTSQFMIQNQIQQINNVGQISRIISQTNDQISDMIMSSYENRQATMDRMSEKFSQAIRGVDEFHNPFEEQGVELPGGYDHAWANSLGEYIVTDDPLFDPNIETNLDWQKMKRRA